MNATLLRNHVAEIEQEKHTAQLLHEEIKRARQLSDQSLAYRFDELLKQTDNLTQFFSALATVMDDTCTEGEITIGKIAELILNSRFDSAKVFTIDPE